MYDSANIFANGTRKTREDDRALAALGLSRNLGKSLKINLDYKYTDNTSNINSYDYTRNVYSVGVSGRF